MIDVTGCVVEIEWRKGRYDRDALSELREFRVRQSLRKLRLSSQNNLQQFLIGRFEIRKKTQRLEHRIVQGLCFIHHDDGSAAGAELANQQVVDCVLQLQQVRAVPAFAQFRGKVAQEIQ